MAFENFPSATTPPPNLPQAPKTDWRFFLTISLLILLLGTWGYIIWDKSKVKESMQQKDGEIASVVSEKETLKGLLDTATMRYDELKTSSAKKDSAITAKDREINEKRARIQTILSKANATKAELAQARAMIASLNTDIESFKTQIEELKGQNLQLTQEKEAVTQERDVVRRNFDSAKTEIKQREDVIDVGSTLHVGGFNITGIDTRNSGKEKETTKAKKVDKLRISFVIDENRITKSGEKELYVCITAPDGKPIAVEALGSGIFTTREGGDKTFTQKVQINYTQGQKQTVSFDWKQNTPFQIGDYKIEVYQNGYKIGEGVRAFRKSGLFG